MRILITGAAGMLGTSLVPVLCDHGHAVLATDIRYLSDEMTHLDVRDLGEFLTVSRGYRPDILMHLAAETDLEVCQSQVEYAYQENFLGTQNACVVCRELDIPLAFVSTAGVFDGRKTEPYTEFDNPNPINVYGATKFHSERLICQTMPNHFIVRAGWMVGGGERDRKFVSKILDQIDKGAKTIYAVTDRMGTPTYAPAFSEILEWLINTRLYGTFHLACKGRATRYDVAAEILGILGRNEISLRGVTSEYFMNEYYAPRPTSEEMRNYMLELMSKDDMPHWKDALETYINKHFSDYVK